MANNVMYVNIEEGIKRVMNNTKLYVKLLVKFKEDTNVKELESALAAGDLEKAQVSAHTIKGIAANLSLIELQKQTLEIETQIKSKSVNPDQINTIKNVYNQTLTEVDKVIEKYA
jgi:HPt (histidine-containing phosphotransfer) domain-containing protein